MRRSMLALAAAFLLAGCLETTDPAFDETTARPVAEVPDFVAFVEFFDAIDPQPELEPGKSPRDLLDSEALAIDLGDMVLVQLPPEEGVYSYATVGVLGERAFFCSSAADEETAAAAAAYGVTATPPESAEGQVGLRISGEQAKVAEFIRAQLAEGPLICFSYGRKRPMAPG